MAPPSDQISRGADGDADADAERILRQAERGFDKDREISRILSAFKLNAYDVLGLTPGVAEDEIRRVYRSKSLLLHPDRNPGDARAADAFDRLKKSHDELLDEKLRQQLDDAWVEARSTLIRERKLSRDDTALLTSPEFRSDLQMRWREVLVQDELKRRKKRQIALAEEGRQRAKADAEAEQRRKDAEQKEKWESTREERVSGWRAFASSSKRKPTTDQMAAATPSAGSKKKKIKMLG